MEKYGETDYATLLKLLDNKAKALDMEIEHFQSNVEGELLNFIQAIHHSLDSWVVINPGAFTHTSIALRDALNTLSAQNKIICHLYNPMLENIHLYPRLLLKFHKIL